MREHGVVATGVLTGGTGSRSDLGTNHGGTFRFSTKHVAKFGPLVKNLVHAAAKEVDEHQFGDGPQTGGGGATRGTDEPGLCDWRVEHAIAAESLDETLGYAHGTAPGIVVDQMIDHSTAGNVLTHQDDSRIFAHGDAECFVDGLL